MRVHKNCEVDLIHEKYFFIIFQYRDFKYFLCKTDNKISFKIFDDFTTDIEKKCIMKFESKLEAKNQLTKIPEFDINGCDIYPEISYNIYEDLLIGV